MVLITEGKVIMSYAVKLKNRQNKLGVWGIGYIGYSTMLHFANEGVECVAYDPNSARVELVNSGEHPVPGLTGWLDIDPLPLLKNGTFAATSQITEILNDDVLIHMVAVPTERGGKPWWEPLQSVAEQLAAYLELTKSNERQAPLIVIESTLAPGSIDRKVIPEFEKRGLQVGRDYKLSLAPRRDWFISADKNLATLDRIYAGLDESSADETQHLLGLVCSTLHRANSYRTGELVKCVENAFRHTEIVLANQLSLAYPNIDVIEALQLASTKWNMGLFQPSFGTGGYCVPLAGQYLLEGANNSEALSLLTAAYQSDLDMRFQVAKAVEERKRKSVGILGLSYRGDLQVSVMSPTRLIAKHLNTFGIKVKVNDPFFSTVEIKDATGAAQFDFPEDIDQFDTLLVATDHSAYLTDEVKREVLARAENLLILDNFGLWKNWDWPDGAQYFVAGARGWLQDDERVPALSADSLI